jgi:CRP-like cAMP-binding protein
MQYKANSVIYFQGDASDKIYILQSGKISLNSNDIETGQEIHDYIQTGEFFGVKSALGRYPREESAIVLSDAAVVVFSVPEFEALALQNTRIVLKMLKVFSNQLRRIHSKVQGLLAVGEQTDPELGLFRIGEYYLKRKQYQRALYAFRKYLTYYPSGAYNQEANRYAQQAEDFAMKYGSGQEPASSVQSVSSGPGKVTSVSRPSEGAKLSDTAKNYYDAVSTFSQQNYANALKQFRAIVDSGTGDQEYTVKSLFEIGRCLFFLNQHDGCIKHFTGLIQKYPKLPDLPDALFYLGGAYQAKGENQRAAGFYKKILSMPSIDEGLKRKVNKAIKSLEG